MKQTETETVGLQILGSCPRIITNGLAEGGLLYQGPPRPQEFCLPGHSRVREWPHGAIPGQGLHLFQVTSPCSPRGRSCRPQRRKETEAQKGEAELHGDQILDQPGSVGGR